jgi:hypothetical protein
MKDKFTRRGYGLAGLGIIGSLAGCLNQANTDQPTEDDTMTWQTGLQVKNTDSLQTEQLDYFIDIENRSRYPVEPLRLSITVRNTGNEAIYVGDIQAVLFEQSTSSSYILIREGLVQDSDYEYNADAQVWVSTTQVERTGDYKSISPEQEFSTTVLVLHQQIPNNNSSDEIETLRTPQTFTNSFTVESAAPKVLEEYQFTVHYQE